MAAPKRKRAAADTNGTLPSVEPPLKRRASARTAAVTNPDINGDILDAPNATRASPDSDVNQEIVPGPINGTRSSESPLSDAPDLVKPPPKKGRAKKADTNGTEAPSKSKVKQEHADGLDQSKPVEVAKPNPKKSDAEFDPEAHGDEEADEEEVKEALSRPPPVNSDYLPLPWKGRLGYACLNTYLRQSNPPVFSSRTCRIQSILEHRHPLQDPSQPEHATKNRPDTSKPADEALGKRYLESVCLANVRDIPKMIRWNDRYGIKFMRLSSEMFPFASHAEYGYTLAPFASEALAEAGKVIAEYGHRVTTHPGQFTQLGSPRKPVIDNAIRDLIYHDEMLSLLKLPDQLNRDAVMILHMGGIFEGKQETLQRFRENYINLPQSVKNRLVLENDDMGWNVHDLLPICEELNIPLVLDYHHHNICFDSTQLREGTKDIIDIYPRIKATWDRKNIKQKMHYSEPTPPAITPRQRRKHSPRVATLPPCAQDMDLMIEAKDKEQAVFELMRTFKLPGYETFNDILPYVRNDDNKVALAALNRKKPKKAKKNAEDEEEDVKGPTLVPDEEVGMGGPEGRVYWPPGMEEWLRPKKREVKKPAGPTAAEAKKTKAKKEAEEIFRANLAAKAKANGGKVEQEGSEGEDSDPNATPATKKAKAAMRKKEKAKAAAKVAKEEVKKLVKGGEKKGKAAKKVVNKKEEVVATPEVSEEEEEELDLDDEEDEEPVTPVVKRAGSRKSSARQVKSKAVKYADSEEGDE